VSAIIVFPGLMLVEVHEVVTRSGTGALTIDVNGPVPAAG
jgi:hypothetical protein